MKLIHCFPQIHSTSIVIYTYLFLFYSILMTKFLIIINLQESHEEISVVDSNNYTQMFDEKIQSILHNAQDYIKLSEGDIVMNIYFMMKILQFIIYRDLTT